METQSVASRLKEVGAWTEQLSSAGKRYYYNTQTNKSQWEKPLEWKQAEKLRASGSGGSNKNGGGGSSGSGQTPTDKVSPTSTTAPKLPMSTHSSAAQHQQHQHRSVVTSSSSSAHRTSATAAFSSTSTPSLAAKPDSSSGVKRPRLDEEAGKVSSSSSAVGQIQGSRKHVGQQQQQVSSTTGGFSSGSFQSQAQRSTSDHHQHQQKASPTIQYSSSSTSGATKRPFPSSSAATKFGSGQFQSNSSSSPGTVGNAMGQNLPKPRPLNSISTGLPLLGSSSSTKASSNKDGDKDKEHSKPTVASTTTMGSNGKLALEKPSPPVQEGFREEKYYKYWRTDMATTRRALGADAFAHEVKRCTDRCAKQTAAIFALDRDIHSIQTLDKTALLRTKLLRQRLDTVRQRIQELDPKPGGGQ